ARARHTSPNYVTANNLRPRRVDSAEAVGCAGVRKNVPGAATSSAPPLGGAAWAMSETASWASRVRRAISALGAPLEASARAAQRRLSAGGAVAVLVAAAFVLFGAFT